MQVATRLGQHGQLGVERVVDDVDAAHRNGDELAEAAGARAADELAVLADVLEAGAAAQADAARHLRVHRHAAADEALAAGRGVDDHADELVPHDQRRRAARAPRRDALDVAAADPGALDPDQHLALPRRRRLDVEDVQRALQRVDEGAHLVAQPHHSTSICA